MLIDAFDVPDAIVVALIRAARRRGALPFALTHHARVDRELMHGAVEAQYAPHTEAELARMEGMQAYIALRGSANILRDVRRPARQREAGVASDEAGAGPAREPHEMGRAALADPRRWPSRRP